MIPMSLLISGTVLYVMLVTSYALLLLPEECVIRIIKRSGDSGFKLSRKEARHHCDMMGYVLQYFEYPLNVGGDADNDEQISKYTCCKTTRYTADDLSCTTVVDQKNSDCLERHEQLEKITDGCQRFSVSHTPIIWDSRSDVCTANKITIRAYLCCELSNVPECVHNNDSCVISVYKSDQCYNPSRIKRVAYDDCKGKMRELQNFKLAERCSDSGSYGEVGFYKKITYACCPSTMKETGIKPPVLENECKFIHVDDYCKTTRIRSQPVCSGSESKVMIVMDEQRCHCPGGPDDEVVKYACCVTNDVCSRIPSDAYPTQYYFQETVHTGTEVPTTIDCYEGSLMRVCTKRGLQATWTPEVNNGCKTREMVRKYICSRIPSDAFPTQYYFEEMLHTGTNVPTTIACHKGSLKRVCMAREPTASWGIETNNDCKTPEMVMNEAKRDSEKGTETSAKKVEEIVNEIDGVVEEALKKQMLAKQMLYVVGNLLHIDQQILLQAENEGGHHKVVSIVENLTSRLHIDDSGSNVISTKDVTVGAYKIDRINEPLVLSSDFQKSDEPDETITIEGPLVTILPEILATLREKNNRIQIIAYRNPKLFVNSISKEYSNRYSVITVFVNLEMSFKSNRTVVMYKIPRDKNDARKFTCVFWDTTTRNWSVAGLDLITDKNGEKICRSTHLSSFHILMDTDADQRIPDHDERYLTYISYIGCGVSMIGLIGTIFTYALFNSLHGDVSGKILLNICVSMLLLNVIFLLGSLDSETYDVGICMAVAISMHYFLLTTLVWMFIEALNMYQMLIVVFFERHRWFMRIRLLAGWGIPLVVVALTMAVSIDNYKPNNQFCFLSHTNQAAFFAAVLAPTCIILFINTYVFIRVSIIVARSSKSTRDTSGSTSSVSVTQVRGAMSVMIVLGITWILGPLAIGPAKVVFAYMFTIFNSIQGFLVFIFRCVFNNEARLSWEYLFATGTRKRKRGTLLTTSTGTWTRSTEQKRKTLKYKGISVAGSDTSFGSQKGNASGNIRETPRHRTESVDYKRGELDATYEHDGDHAEQPSEIDFSSKYSEVDIKPPQTHNEHHRDIKREYKRATMNDYETTSSSEMQFVGSLAELVQSYDDRAVMTTESHALISMVPSWIATSKSSLRKETAKIKRTEKFQVNLYRPNT